MSEELKRCPFCGGEPSEYWPNSSTKHYVQCNKCGARTALYLASHGGSAKDDWNSRSDPSQARLSEAVKVLEEAKEALEIAGGFIAAVPESVTVSGDSAMYAIDTAHSKAKSFLATLGEET